MIHGDGTCSLGWSGKIVCGAADYNFQLNFGTSSTTFFNKLLIIKNLSLTNQFSVPSSTTWYPRAHIRPSILVLDGPNLERERGEFDLGRPGCRVRYHVSFAMWYPPGTQNFFLFNDTPSVPIRFTFWSLCNF